jgi:phage terminase small subunit
MNKPPKHLSASTRRWVRHVADTYSLEQHHWGLLCLAAESWDRAEQAAVVIREQGMTYNDRFGAPRARPECAVERDSRIAFARLIRELGLDKAETPETGGMQPRRSNEATWSPSH